MFQLLEAWILCAVECLSQDESFPNRLLSNGMVTKLERQSRRPCPVCKGVMYYVPTMFRLLTGRWKRVCQTCGYVDPLRVKIVRDDGSY